MKKILFIIILTLVCWNSFGVKHDYNFRKITPSGGLSFQVIHAITQDKQGNMWLGTYEGIYKYNSKYFKQYSHSAVDSTSLINNEITGLVVDSKNVLWVGTHKGICTFNVSGQNFTPFRYNSLLKKGESHVINDLTLDKKGNIWVIEQSGVGKLDTINHTIKYLPLGKSKQRPTSIFFNTENVGFIGTDKGSVYGFDPEDFSLVTITQQIGKSVSTLYADQNRIWVGYKKHGLQLFAHSGELLKDYSYRHKGVMYIHNEHVRDVMKDDLGNLWIGTYNGLFLEQDDKLYLFNQKSNPQLGHNSIYALFKDQDGGIWIGTWSGGLNYMHYSDNTFVNYRKTNARFSLSDNIVSSFAQQEKRYIYIGTEVGGLNEFDLRTHRFREVELTAGSKKGINIKALYTDCYGGLWVGTYNNGVFYRPRNEKIFRSFTQGQEDGAHVSNKSIYSIVGDKKGVWIGTDGGSINYYSFASGKIAFFESLFPNMNLGCKYVRSLYIDSYSSLWIGTYSGLYKIRNNELKSFYSSSRGAISNDHILHINQLSDGNIWVSTKAGGISIINALNDSVVHFNANGLLKERDVYGVIEDVNQKIWITSKEGLIFYDPQQKNFRQFLLPDGIQGNVFNPQAIFMDTRERLYVGGTNGFSQISPSNINMNERAPNIIFDKLIINNKKQIHIDQKQLFRASDIFLKSNETAIRVDFLADNYLLPQKNRYQYRLVNFNDEWIDAGKEGTAVFTNLPSGEYIFEAKAANNDGVWNEKPASIKIIIATPWWRNIWAYLIYSILSLVIVVIIIRSIMERQNLKKAVLIEKIQRENEEQIHEMKIKFFTNISHEFRTPLTLIHGPAKRLLESGQLNDSHKDVMDVILRNSDRLLELINKVLDLRRVEQGYNKLHVSRFDIVDFIEKRSLHFTQEALVKNINFEVELPSQELWIEADEDMLDKIIFNLLSNAFKFTPENRTITLSLSPHGIQDSSGYSNQLKFGQLTNEDFFEIAIKDSGIGVDSEELLCIFNRFEKGKSSGNNSSGIGLSLCKEYVLLHHGEIITQSNPGNGTRFLIRLPQKQSAQDLIYGISGPMAKKTEDFTPSRKPSIEEDIKNEDPKPEILVVEDNQDLRNYIVSVLQARYKIEQARDGVEALHILESGNCDLVISDVMMPRMDGFELCSAIKSNLAISHIPVIILTALSSVPNKMLGLEQGADAYISKPFEDELLLSQIRNLIQQRETLRESFKKQFSHGEQVSADNPTNYFLNKVDQIIESKYSNEEFSVEYLAKEIGLHRSQLHRKLKQLTSYSATEYIRVYRLKRSSELLKNGEYNIDEVAFLIGFGSRSYFSKCFKEFFDISPKQYQQKHLNK